MRYTHKHGDLKLALRSPDNASNLYLTVSLALRAGLEGIMDGLTLAAVPAASLPLSMSEAIKDAKNSAFLKTVLGEPLLSAYLAEKKKVLGEYESDEEGYFQKEFQRL